MTLSSCQPVDSNAPPPTVKVAASSSTRAASRKNRIYVLRKFLLETYPHLFCRRGETTTSSTSTAAAAAAAAPIILDVAGGKGDLGWLLRNADRVENVIIVDPRITKHRHMLKSIAYLHANPDLAKERAIPDRPTHQPLASLVMDGLFDRNSAIPEQQYFAPKHLRLLVNNDLVQALRSYVLTKDMAAWKTFWIEALSQARQAQPLGHHEDEMEHQGTTIYDAQQALNILLNVQLIVGFHPDQATEACIDMALLLNIDYCVVPCCVFPSEFPNRVLQESGERVRSYNELIPYLKGKNPDQVRSTELAFHESTTARRIVLYRIGNQYDA